MNIEEIKINGVNKIHIYDSLNAPLLELKIKPKEGTIEPNNKDLKIYIDKSETETKDKKTYTYTLKEKLQVNDEFVIKPTIKENKVLLETYVLRQEEKEMLNTEEIILFEGVNYISTNYTNVEISVVYPKNIDLVNFFLNTSIYGINNKNKILTLDDIYFKNCFTNTDYGVNASFNELKVKCISSESDSFRLDYAGNLRVKSLIVMDDLNETNIDFDLIYPVGSIYMTLTNINPSTLFGGTWERIAKGKTLVGLDEEDTDFNVVRKTGGEKTHRLIVEEIPKHNHEVCLSGDTYTDFNATYDYVLRQNYRKYDGQDLSGYRGGDQPHNNLQPYFTCYIWTRVS